MLKNLAPAIQPHGWLIVCDARAKLVLRGSANLGALFPHWTGPFPGADLSALLGSQAAHAARNALSRFSGASSRPALLPGLRLAGRSEPCDLTVAPEGEEALIVIEPAQPTEGSDCDRLGAMIDRIAPAADIDRLCVGATRLIFSILQYDRVALLRFEPDDGARTVATQKAYDLAAPDAALCLPPQARARLAAEPARLIVDAEAAPVALISGDGSAGDLAGVWLRAADSGEREALRRGGFAASLALALPVGGELWGLVLCQHRTPKTPALELRASVAIFCDVLSLRLEILALRQAARR